MTMHECRDRARMLGSYLDGQLETSKLIEIEEHVEECDACQEEVRLLRAMRASLKRVVRVSAPNGLRDRIGNAMAAERSRDELRAADAGAVANGSARRARLRTLVPIATAAAIALMWSTVPPGGKSNVQKSSVAGFGDDLLAELVAEHSQPLPPEVTNARDVRSLERYVGFPVHPANFERMGAHLVGGRVVPLQSQRAAMLQYIVGSGDNARRVSILVYDAEKIQVGDANLAPRAVGSAEVRVGREKGYSVAATQRAGVGYLLASDLDPDESAQIAALAYDDR